MDYQTQQHQLMDLLETHQDTQNFPAALVEPTSDYDNDTRKYLTIIARPTNKIVEHINDTIIHDLHQADPRQYYCHRAGLHFTLLSIKLFPDGSNFPKQKIRAIATACEKVFQRHHPIELEFESILRVPTSVGIRCISSQAFGNLIDDLKAELKKIDVVSDKKLISDSVYFGNITVCRFKPNLKPTPEFDEVVNSYRHMHFGSFVMNAAELVHANAVANPPETKVHRVFYL